METKWIVENKIYITDEGEVIDDHIKLPLKYSHDANGHKVCYVNGKMNRVHNLVIKYFTDKYEKGMHVIHLDGDEDNCALANLEVQTKSQTALQIHATQKNITHLNNLHVERYCPMRMVNAKDPTNFVDFDSAEQAAIYLMSLNPKMTQRVENVIPLIKSAAKRKTTTCYGYYWSFLPQKKNTTEII